MCGGREALRLVVLRSDQLVAFLRSRGPLEPQNVDKLLLRESMDVIGGLFALRLKRQILDAPVPTAAGHTRLSICLRQASLASRRR